MDYTLADNAKEQAAIDELTAGNAPVCGTLYTAYAENLRKAVGRVFADGGNPELAARLCANVSRFAAYKAYHATRLARKAAAEPDGDPRRVLRTFNRYQAAEHNTAVSRSRTAKQFSEFTQSDNARLFPNLRWLHSRSASPREQHMRFYNRVWAKSDPFWLQNQPGNLWNCKCDWEQTADPCTGGNPTAAVRHDGLDGNPALTGEIFTDNSAYVKKCSKNDKKKIERYVGDKILRKESRQALHELQGKTVSIVKSDEIIDVLFDYKTTKHLSNDVARCANFLWNELLKDIKRVLEKSKLVAHEMNTKKSDKPSAVEYLYYEYKIKGDSLYFSIEENFVEYENRHFYRLYAVSGTLRNSVVFYK